MTKELCVLMDSAPIGTLTQNQRGHFHFSYDDQYRKQDSAVPMSLSMPLAVVDHGDKTVRPFLWGPSPTATRR